MLLVDADDAPSRRGSNYAGDDMVGGLGRRGVPRLKLYGFHSSSSSASADGSSSSGSSGPGAALDPAQPSPYVAPEVSAMLA